MGRETEVISEEDHRAGRLMFEMDEAHCRAAYQSRLLDDDGEEIERAETEADPSGDVRQPERTGRWVSGAEHEGVCVSARRHLVLSLVVGLSVGAYFLAFHLGKIHTGIELILALYAFGWSAYCAVSWWRLRQK